MAEFSRHYFLAPVLLLALISFGSVFIRSSSPQNENPPQLKGSVSKVERLQSWIRERAIDRLPWTTTNRTEDYDEEANKTLNAMNAWAASGQNNTNLVVDVVSIGSSSKMEYLHNQRNTWASPTFVRNMFMATEINTDRSIILEDASCQALELSCAKSVETDAVIDSAVELQSRWLQDDNRTTELTASDTDEPLINATMASSELCLQRRLGLAMGVSVRRYRKISRAFKLHQDAMTNDAGILPNFLIVTFDHMSYNTTRLKRCEENGKSLVFAPSISKHLTETSFPVPTNRTGVVFNRLAMARWMMQVPCSSTDTQAYDSDSFVSNFCSWIRDISSNESQNIFDTALIHALDISKDDPITEVKAQNQTMSVSDLFYKYSYSIHLLCSEQNDVVPSGEEMMGYLIHRFNISDSPIGQSECINEFQYNSS